MPGASEAVSSADGKLSARVGGMPEAVAAITSGRRTTGYGPEDLAFNKLVITESDSGKVLQTIPLVKPSTVMGVDVGRLAFNSRGLVVQFCERAVKSNEPDCHVKTFDPFTGKELRDFKPGKTESRALAGQLSATALVSPNGRFLISIPIEMPKATGSGSKFGIGRTATAPSKMIQPYTMNGTDVDSGRKVWEIKGVSESAGAMPILTFSSDDALLAVTTIDKDQRTIQVCDTTSGRLVRSIEAGDRTIDGLTFSHDRKRVAVTYLSSSQGLVYGAQQRARSEPFVDIYDLSTGRLAFTLVHETSVTGVAFSPNGRLIATIAQDRNEYLWNVDTGEKLATLVNLDVLSTFGPPNGSP